MIDGHRFNVRGVLVTDGDCAVGKQGAFFFLDSSSGDYDVALGYTCPCGCGSEGCVSIGLKVKPPGKHTWEWDGDKMAPTLAPSIRRIGGCKWHGHLQAGVWVPQPDSGQ